MSNVGQLEPAYVPIEGLIIDPDIYGLLDGPGNVVHLPTNYGEIVQTNAITRGVAIVIEGGGGPEVLLDPFLKSHCQFPKYCSSQPTWSHLKL